MESQHLLVVEDEAQLLNNLCRGLGEEGFSVLGTSSAEAAQRAVENGQFDAIVLDLRLPGKDGLEFLSEIRAVGNVTPVLILTAHGSLEERVAGLDTGADDYLVKPFASEELMARARALLRRGSEPDELLAYGDLVFEVRARSARRGEREIALSAREAEMLELLLRNPRQVISRVLALERVWGGQSAATLNAVDRCVSYLRRKLGDPPLIQTVRGVGFMLGR
jgi:two-component system, OmpR family, response regulator MprA